MEWTKPARRSLALLVLALWPRVAESQEPRHFALQDDRGEPVQSPLEVCFERDLRTDCTPWERGKPVVAGGDFQRLRIEGPDHGPSSWVRMQLQSLEERSLRLPRKARLQILRESVEPVTVSLYSPTDPTFRSPAARLPLGPQGWVKIPTGVWIASSSSGRWAPHLSRLDAAPGADLSLRFVARSGWSLIARVLDESRAVPLDKAAVSVSESPGYDQPRRELARAETWADGLALFSGLTAPLAELAVSHPSRLPRQDPGVAAAPGAFALREVMLPHGGTLRASVMLGDRPAAGFVCQVVDRLREPDDPRRGTVLLWQGSTDPQGICRSGRIAAGSYELRLRGPDGKGMAGQPVTLQEGLETQETVKLWESRVLGRVTRGERPCAGYAVEASLLDLGSSPGLRLETVASATTDEEGHYEMTLWQSGDYGFTVRLPSGTPAAGTFRATIDELEETRDFALQPGSFHGSVVDGEKEPVEGAGVVLRFATGMRTATTLADGRFEFAAAEPGRGRLQVFKSGYKASEPLEIELREDVESPPVVVVLEKVPVVKGRVSTAMGAPVDHAWINARTETSNGETLDSRSTRTDSAGKFEVELPAAGQKPRLWISGPGCPLSVFVLPAEGGEELSLHCPAMPAALDLQFLDAAGRPIPHAGVLLRREGETIPRQNLLTHLGFLGLAGESDGNGRLFLPHLSPGNYEVYLAGATSESFLAAGRRDGFLAAVSLPPLGVTEMSVSPATGAD